jgi:hypothetical protein
MGTSSPRSWWRSELSALPVPLAASVISGWSEVPTTADQGLADAAEPMCVSEAGANHLRDDLVIRDQRGPDAAAYLWADGREAMYCLVTRDVDGNVDMHLLGGSESRTGQLTTTDVTCGSPTLVAGTVPAGTEQLVIETRGGLEVTASVADGRFLAWWPGRDDPVALRTDTTIADLVGGWY